MKIQVAASISTDGFLQLENTESTSTDLGIYSFRPLQEQADLILHKESSLIALLEEKRTFSNTNYFVEFTSDTLSLIKGLFLYRLADELILYITPFPKENRIRLFDLTSPSDWELIKTSYLKERPYLLIYQRTK